MSKTFLATIAFSALFAAAAHAEVEFRGTLVFQSPTVECVDGPGNGEAAQAVLFHPKTVTGFTNKARSSLVAFWRSGSLLLLLKNGNFNGTLQTVENAGIGWSDYSSGAVTQVSATGLPAISTSTKTVTFTGQIKNPFGTTGQENCVVNYLYVGVRE